VLGLYILKENIIYMSKITLAQREALDVVKDMIDVSDRVPEFGTKIMTLIFGILNIDYGVEHTITTDITDIEGGKTIPINPDSGNDRIQINIPNIPGVQIFPGEISHPEPAPWEPRVWYNNEPEPIQTDAREDVRYVTEVSCTSDKNGIVCTTNTADIQYNGDFRDVQTSFNDK
jgi:hypothetical protein